MTWYLSYMNGVIQFLIGFIVGSLVDFIFFRIYKKIDPKERSRLLLVITIILQLNILVWLIIQTDRIGWKGPMDNYFLRIGLISSQLFLLEYAIGKFVNDVYYRSPHHLFAR